MAIMRASTTAGTQVAAASKDGTNQQANAPSSATDTGVAARPAASYAAVGLVLAAIGLGVGLYLLGSKHPGLTNLPEVAVGTSTFAILYVFAQAIERLLVPVSWFGGGFLNGLTKKKVKQNQQFAQAEMNAAADADMQSKTQAAANAAHDADQYRANLTATSFGVASLLAFIAVGYSGALFLHLGGIKAAGWLDLLVTGLAIAGGTKPLHDLIDNVTKASAAKSGGTT
jgi:hypothetical protein